MRYLLGSRFGLFNRLVIAGLLVLGGCNRTSEGELPAVEPEEAEPTAFYFESFARGPHAAFSDTTTLVIRDEATWAAYQDQLRAVQPAEPIDFTQTMVLLAAVPTSAGGYFIEFESVEKAGEEIVASYLLTAPGRDCLVIPAPAMPYEVVLTRRDEAPVRFEQRTTTYPCGL